MQEDESNRVKVEYYCKIDQCRRELEMSHDLKGSSYFNDEKPSTKRAIALAISECLATATFVFVTCLGCIDLLVGETLYSFQKSLVAGMSVMIAIHNFGHISGAHVNPISTICAVILKATPLVMLPIYILAQLSGSALGYGLLKSVTPFNHFPTSTNETHGICVTAASSELTTMQIVGFEILLSTVLTFANCAAFDPINSSKSETIPLKFGLLVATLITAAGPITGAVMNPARSFGPAVWNNDWQYHWIYWIAPVCAATIVSIFYRILFIKSS